MRTLGQWSREVPADLLRLDDQAVVELRRTAEAGAELARARGPVVTGALQPSISVRPTPDGAEVYSEDPAASALAEAGRPIIRDAVLEVARGYPDELTEQWTEALIGR